MEPWTALSSNRETGEIAAAWCKVGDALAARDQKTSAVWAYRQALTHKPDCLPALMALGCLHHVLGRPAEAVAWFERALAINPLNVRAHVEWGRAWHHLGDVERGFAGFAWAFRRAQPRSKAIEQPLWNGRTSLSGRSILVWENLGLGDAILHLRYLPPLKRRGARVIFEGSHLLKELLERFEAIDLFVVHDANRPRVDTHVPLALLPALFSGEEATATPIPVPYLAVDRWRREQWKARINRDERFTIGLVWAGDEKHATGRRRSMPVSVYAPFREVEGVRFVSLQYGHRAGEFRDAPADVTIEPLLDASCTIADTAAAILNLDLVVTVDTMVAHLSGALGVPVWTLLRRTPAWMWQRGTRDSVWYPTMELFRQSEAGEWPPLLEEVATRLKAESHHVGASRPPRTL